MLREYAVEPEVFSNWEVIRHIISECGVHNKGRMISNFPKKEWIRLVCEQIDKFPSQMDSKRAKEYLLSNKSKLISMGRAFDRQKDWLNNAIQSHQEKSFQGVLVKSDTPNEAGILKVDEMTFEETEWNIDSDSKIPRTTEAIVEAAASLLRISRSVALVDRNFHFYNYQKEPIVKLYKQAREATPLSSFYMHVSSLRQGIPVSEREFKKECEDFIKLLDLPPNKGFVFVRWKKRKEGENQHPRYVLTDCGGISYDHGLDEGKSGETTDVKLLGKKLWEERWAQYQPNSKVLEHVDSWLLKDGLVKRL